MAVQQAQHVELIPIDRINILNPRVRAEKAFRDIVESIASVGLKRPITVTERKDGDRLVYDLVCGQGRLEAFRELGQQNIPALVVTADVEDCLVASLVENCARRQHRAIDLLHDIGGMKRRGHSPGEIARKTGLSTEYVVGVNRLLDKGEERLLQSVEAGQMPISVAIEIADSDEPGIQQALQHAYESNILRGRKLFAAKRLVEQRRRRGKQIRSWSGADTPALSSATLLHAYREETDRKRLLVKRAERTRNRLTFVIEALRKLFADQAMLGILAREGLADMPTDIYGRVTELRSIAS